MIRLLLVVVLLAGCASSKILTGTQRPPISPALVKIYSQPPANFEEIAIIDASSKSSFAIGDQGKMDVVIQRLKEEAASVGANGVLLTGTGAETTGGMANTYRPANQPYSTGFYSAAQHKTGQARAIFVKD